MVQIEDIVDHIIEKAPYLIGVGVVGYVAYKMLTGARKGTGGGGEAKGQ